MASSSAVPNRRPAPQKRARRPSSEYDPFCQSYVTTNVRGGSPKPKREELRSRERERLIDAGGRSLAGGAAFLGSSSGVAAGPSAASPPRIMRLKDLAGRPIQDFVEPGPADAEEAHNRWYAVTSK